MFPAGPLACQSLPSVMSWIRSDTPIWKLALSQSCSPRIKEGWKRVKCLLRSWLNNEIDVQYLKEKQFILQVKTDLVLAPSQHLKYE